MQLVSIHKIILLTNIQYLVYSIKIFNRQMKLVENKKVIYSNNNLKKKMTGSKKYNKLSFHNVERKQITCLKTCKIYLIHKLFVQIWIMNKQ